MRLVILSCQIKTVRLTNPAGLQGKDATEEFEPIHPPDTLDKYLDKSKHLGLVDMSSVAIVEKAFDPEEEERQQRIKDKPTLEQCYNLMDFEAVAKRTMKKGAWGYYSSAADDEIVCTFLFILSRTLAQLRDGSLITGRRYERTTRLSTGYGSGLGSLST
jgi:hypothetical protein